MLSRVLVAFDGSTCSQEALKLAALLVEAGCEATVCHVIDYSEPSPFAWLTPGEEREWSSSEVYRYIDEMIQGEIERNGGGTTRFLTHVLQGHPADALLEAAEKLKAEMIVMGSHGRSGLRRAVLGSISEMVTHASRVPVITVHANEIRAEAPVAFANGLPARR